jgi:uncharacterized protein (DUF433 family)
LFLIKCIKFVEKSQMSLTFKDFEYIVADQDYCDGQPRIVGTRITVAAILSYLAGGMSVEKIVEEFPKLKPEHVYESLKFAAANFGDKYIPLARRKTAA